MLLNEAPHHGDVLGDECIASRILNLGPRWRWVVSFTPRPLSRRKRSPWNPLVKRLGWPQNRSGCGCELCIVILCEKYIILIIT